MHNFICISFLVTNEWMNSHEIFFYIKTCNQCPCTCFSGFYTFHCLNFVAKSFHESFTPLECIQISEECDFKCMKNIRSCLFWSESNASQEWLVETKPNEIYVHLSHFLFFYFFLFSSLCAKKKGFKCQTIHFIYFFIVIICKNFYKHFIKYICQKFLVIYVFAVSACVSLYSVFRCRCRCS